METYVIKVFDNRTHQPRVSKVKGISQLIGALGVLEKDSDLKLEFVMSIDDISLDEVKK